MAYGYGMMGWENGTGYPYYGMMGGWGWLGMLVGVALAALVFSLIFWYTYKIMIKNEVQSRRNR